MNLHESLLHPLGKRAGCVVTVTAGIFDMLSLNNHEIHAQTKKELTVELSEPVKDQNQKD